MIVALPGLFSFLFFSTVFNRNFTRNYSGGQSRHIVDVQAALSHHRGRGFSRAATHMVNEIMVSSKLVMTFLSTQSITQLQELQLRSTY